MRYLTLLLLTACIHASDDGDMIAWSSDHNAEDGYLSGTLYRLGNDFVLKECTTSRGYLICDEIDLEGEDTPLFAKLYGTTREDTIHISNMIGCFKNLGCASESLVGSYLFNNTRLILYDNFSFTLIERGDTIYGNWYRSSSQQGVLEARSRCSRFLADYTSDINLRPTSLIFPAQSGYTIQLKKRKVKPNIHP